MAPVGWRAETAADGDAYRFTAWLGPQDKEQLWGAPRFVVAWYADGRPVREASGETAMYRSADDYIRQMLATVWRPSAKFLDGPRATAVAGRPGQRMVVRVRKDAFLSLPGANPGEPMWREDEAVLVPTRRGFYAIVFPSSADARPRYAAAFERFLASLRFTKESPADGF